MHSATATGLFFRHCGVFGPHRSHLEGITFPAVILSLTHIGIVSTILDTLLFSGAFVIPNKIFRKPTQCLTYINLPFLAEEGFKRSEMTHYQLPLQAPQLSIPLLQSALPYPARNRHLLSFQWHNPATCSSKYTNFKRRTTGFFEIIHEILHLLSTLLGHLAENKEH